MRFCTFKNPKGEIKVGYEKEIDYIAELSDYTDMIDLIVRYPDEIQKIKKDSGHTAVYPRAAVRLMPPVHNPNKMIFVGLNYRDHAKESNVPIPQKPIFFAKFNNSLAADGDTIIIPSETQECDYEVELAVIIGKKTKYIESDEAMNHVFGYTICNDLSARDLQLQEGSQWTRGKAIDNFAPMGPFAVTTDEITDPHSLNISCRINGEYRQNESTAQLIFNVPYLISHLSKTMTLLPGDIISTGTPAGVAFALKPPKWLQPNDVVEAAIEGIGVLRNTMARESFL